MRAEADRRDFLCPCPVRTFPFVKNIYFGEGTEPQNSDGGCRDQKGLNKKVGGQEGGGNRFRGTVESGQHSMTLKISSISLSVLLYSMGDLATHSTKRSGGRRAASYVGELA